MIGQNLPAKVPAWSMAVAAMLGIQMASALSVRVIEQVGPAGTAWLRLSFGVALLWLISPPKFGSIRRRDVPALLALGAATGLMTTFFLSALERIELGTAVSIEFLGPLVVAAVMSPHRKALIWPLVALAGVLLLTEPWRGEIDLLGVAFALLAGACWGTYNVLTQHVGSRFEGISGLSLTIPVAALVALPMGLPQVLGGDVLWWVLPTAAGIALLAPVIAFALEMASLRRMTQTAFGTLLSVEPALAVLIGLIVLTQLPSPVQLLGIALVVVAAAAAQRGGKRPSTGTREEAVL
ncbi:EamA family transporter [Gordonia alkaliphila]|uniref:DMT family transporter n=1 Tax=Gordonia phosphorivorans TaxID=1056982 RepID=A0ABV6H6D4_9ACTN|nr:EamA family transporter [Gordonia alkaliphila]MCK0438145.1 EamA family transporter [Gordonia alkaliphila]